MKDLVEYSDFEKIDLRVGKVTDASLPEWSKKLIRYEVDFGKEIGKRIMFSGIRKWYKPEDMVNNKYVFVVNMAPKKMGPAAVQDSGEARPAVAQDSGEARPEESEGMMIMADGVEAPILIPVPDEVELGEAVR